MPTSTWILLGSSVLGSATSTVTFSSINSGYRDLVIVFDGGVTSRTGQFLEFNGDTTGGNYSNVNIIGTGSGSGTSSSAANRIFNDVIENAAVNNALIHIMDYNESKHKNCIIRTNNATVNGVELRAYRWANTAAITSISLVASGTTWLAGSSFYLYGIVG